MPALDKDALLATRIGDTIDVPIGDGYVTVRGLSVKEVEKWGGKSRSVVQREIVSACMIDPVLTPDEVEAWSENAPIAALVNIIKAINKLSDVSPGAAKKSMAGVRGKRKR